MTRPGIEPQSPGPLANTVPTRPIGTLCHILLMAERSDKIRQKKIVSTQFRRKRGGGCEREGEGGEEGGRGK